MSAPRRPSSATRSSTTSTRGGLSVRPPSASSPAAASSPRTIAARASSPGGVRARSSSLTPARGGRSTPGAVSPGARGGVARRQDAQAPQTPTVEPNTPPAVEESSPSARRSTVSVLPRRSRPADDCAIKVGVRVRPFNAREKNMGAKVAVSMNGGTTTLTAPDGTTKSFNYDFSYWSHDSEDPHYASQQHVFNDLGVSVIENAWEGYNSTLFAYGQTGSGKSYSMVGVDNGRKDKGIIPLVCAAIFQELKDNPPENTQVKVWVSMLEIYNERLRDLLDLSGSSSSTAEGLKLKQNKHMGFYVEGLSKHGVSSEEEVMELLDLGSSSRTIRATDMNATSSRAHTVFSITMEQVTVTDIKGVQNKRKKSSVINLVDLAGSERAKKTNAQGEALKEGSSINLSLMYLGQVTSMLAEGNPNVPYRSSKLTSLLKESLGGNAKTCLIAAISPSQNEYEETLGTLQFAARTKTVKNKAKVNVDESSRVLNELQNENQRLMEELHKLQTGGAGYAQEIELAFAASKEEIKRVFNGLDLDGSGAIDSEEFGEFLTAKDDYDLGRFGEIISILQLEANPFEAVDADGDGQITWDEFEDWVKATAKKSLDPKAEMARLQSLLEERERAVAELSDPDKAELEKLRREQTVRSKMIHDLQAEVSELRERYGVTDDVFSAFLANQEGIKALFNEIDKDGTGSVDPDEFQDFLSRTDRSGEFGSLLRILQREDSSFASMDANGDGELSWDEFTDWVRDHAVSRIGPSAQWGGDALHRIQVLEERAALYDEEIHAKNTEIDTLAQQELAQREEIRGLNAEVDSLTRQVQAQQEEIHAKSSEIDTLTQQTQAQEEEIRALVRKVDLQKQALDTANEFRQELEQESAESEKILNEQISELQKALDAEKTKAMRQQDQVTTLTTELDTHATELSSAGSVAAELRLQLHRKSLEAESLSQQLVSKTSILTQAKTCSEELSRKFHQLTDERDGLLRRYDATVKETERAVTHSQELKLQLTALQADLEQLNARLSRKESEADRCREQAASLHCRTLSLQEEQTCLKRHVEVSDAELVAQATAVAELQRSNSALDDTVRHLEEQLTTSRSELLQAREQSSELRRQINRYVEEIDVLTRRVSVSNSEAEEAASKAAELSRQVHCLEEGIESQRRRVSTLTAEAEHASSQVLEYQRRRTQQEEEHNELQKRLTISARDNEGLSGQIVDLTRLLAMTKEELSALETRFALKLKELEQETVQNAELLNSKTVLSARVEQLVAQSSALEGTVGELSKEIETLEAASKENKVLHNKNQQLEEDLQASKEAQRVLHVEVSKQQAIVAEKERQVIELERTISTLHESLSSSQHLLEQRDAHLKEADATLASHRKLLAESDETVSQKLKLINDLHQQLAERDRHVHEKECLVSDKDVLAAQATKRLAELERLRTLDQLALEDREKQIAERDVLLAEKDRKIAAKDAELVEQLKSLALSGASHNSEISEKNRKVHELESERARMLGEHIENNVQLADKVRHLAQQKTDLEARLALISDKCVSLELANQDCKRRAITTQTQLAEKEQQLQEAMKKAAENESALLESLRSQKDTASVTELQQLVHTLQDLVASQKIEIGQLKAENEKNRKLLEACDQQHVSVIQLMKEEAAVAAAELQAERDRVRALSYSETQAMQSNSRARGCGPEEGCKVQ